MTGTRILTGVVLVPVVVGIVLFAPTWVVAICVAVVVVLALREFFDLGAKVGFRGHPGWTMVSAGTLVLSQWLASEVSQGHTDLVAVQFPWLRFLSVDFVFITFAFGVAIAALTSRREAKEALGSASVSAGGFLFVAYPLCYLTGLHGVAVEGPRLLLLTLVVVWAGDSAAYFVGRALGRHKMAPAISPNKTWEGAVANVFVSAGIALVFIRWLDVTWLHLVGIGLAVSVAGQLGDLLESAFKRSAGVKDSGTLLPGHGGMLDRIDALIFAAPAVLWYLQIFVWRR